MSWGRSGDRWTSECLKIQALLAITPFPVPISGINCPWTTRAANVLIGTSISGKHNPFQMVQMFEGPGIDHFYFVFH
jgi:hypothetical protein